jgi:hypothetical protein
MQNPAPQNALLSTVDFFPAHPSESAGEALVLRPVVLSVHAWDLHVDQCDLCLVDGNDLCFEGQYLHDDVVGRRLHATPVRPEPPRPLLAPRRRPVPAFAGASA